MALTGEIKVRLLATTKAELFKIAKERSRAQPGQRPVYASDVAREAIMEYLDRRKKAGSFRVLEAPSARVAEEPPDR